MDMTFDIERVYTPKDADKLKIGSSCFFANSIGELQKVVEKGDSFPRTLKDIKDKWCEKRFIDETLHDYSLCYIVEEPEIWVVYLHRGLKEDDIYLSAGLKSRWESIQSGYNAKSILFEGTYNECVEWYESRRELAHIIKAYEDGEKIQYYNKTFDVWCALVDTSWSFGIYRIVKSLEWTDLKLGDKLERKDGTKKGIIVEISDSEKYIICGCVYISECELEGWEMIKDE